MPDGDCTGMSSSAEKDPRKRARKYQLELCKKALEENIVIYLGTGCGKTHVAVLLIYELGHLIKRPQKSVCVFLAPTVALVQQQARVIEESTDFKVSVLCGGNKHLKSHDDWEQEIVEHEVLAMTPQVLLRGLHHCFIKMEFISILVFDECHHAQIQSDHPYAEIMKMFYKSDAPKLPRIFGMTASPVVGKGAFDGTNLSKSINSLELLLNAKVYTVENSELEGFVASPSIRAYYYESSVDIVSSYMNQLEELKQECISLLTSRKNGNDESLRELQSSKRLLNRVHNTIVSTLESLGICGALNAARFLVNQDCSMKIELMEEDGASPDFSICDKYLVQSAKIFSNCPDDITTLEMLEEPFFSKKLLRLIGVLSNFSSQPDMKCIIFVNRVIIARSLSQVLKSLRFLMLWRSHFLVGVNSGQNNVSRKDMHMILQKFRSGELNLLVATKVGEEGLDIQTCCFVIRFDLPETVSSFIQSRGRARMPQSEYVFLVNSGCQREIQLIENFRKDEEEMNVQIYHRTATETFPWVEQQTYKVDSTGASVSSGYSTSLLHQYCSKLPHDEFFLPKPEFYFFDDSDGTVCNLVLPPNAPIHRIASAPCPSLEAARKDACLKAIEKLHNLGVLSNYLLPGSTDAEDNNSLPTESDSDQTSDKLHEMCVPSVLKDDWGTSEDYINLHSYYIKVKPVPPDRRYKDFALFLNSPLPVEAENMEIDLHLAHGRSVFSKLCPASITKFDKNEITMAECFQEMSFKAIFTRSELIPDFVPLGRKDNSESSISRFYLLLPVDIHENENKLSIDWVTITRCLSSPLFKFPCDFVEEGNTKSVNPKIRLANGSWTISDVENSFVYAVHNKLFYFVVGVDLDRNGHNKCDRSGCTTHAETFYTKYGIHLQHPEQPPLRLKPLFNLRNLLLDRKKKNIDPKERDEYIVDNIPPEICQLKIVGFSKCIGSSLSLLPSLMHHLENLLVAVQLKHMLCASFPEAAEVAAHRFLEAITTEKCQERFSLERLEILGDAFLKYAVGRHLFLAHDSLDEGELTRRRSNAVKNSTLFRLALKRNLQVYIRDRPYDTNQFFAFGHPCPINCNEETESVIHFQHHDLGGSEQDVPAIRCCKDHHWLQVKTVADVVEALVGLFVVDSGFKAATAFLHWIGLNVNVEGLQVQKACIASKNYLRFGNRKDTTALEEVLGHSFLHKGLLLQALVHPSYRKNGGGCYQRLEFLGDATLDYLITSYFFSVYPNLKPGQLTELRSILVNNWTFADIAVSQSLYKFLLCDSKPLWKAMDKYANFVADTPSDNGHTDAVKCPKVLGDVVESCFGAIVLDTGFNLTKVWKSMLAVVDPVRRLSAIQLNPVKELHELCQAYNGILEFNSSKDYGKCHIEAKVTMENCPTIIVSASHHNKKDGIRTAAELMIKEMKTQGFNQKAKSLEAILNSSRKMEAKLIGYNETTVDVTLSDVIEYENLRLTERSSSQLAGENEQTCIIQVTEKLPASFEAVKKFVRERDEGTSSMSDSLSRGEQPKKSLKSLLRETCAANCWKAPVFECCCEEGEGHMKLFTFKVIVDVEDSPRWIVECDGKACSRKKVAAESAAEGALWCLKNLGYVHEQVYL